MPSHEHDVSRVSHVGHRRYYGAPKLELDEWRRYDSFESTAWQRGSATVCHAVNWLPASLCPESGGQVASDYAYTCAVRLGRENVLVSYLTSRRHLFETAL